MANYPQPTKGSRHNAGTGYESGIRRQLREDRRVQAKVRQDLYDALTLEQRLTKLGSAPAKKERAKLAKAIAARDNQPKAKGKKVA